MPYNISIKCTNAINQINNRMKETIQNVLLWFGLILGIVAIGVLVYVDKYEAAIMLFLPTLILDVIILSKLIKLEWE